MKINNKKVKSAKQIEEANSRLLSGANIDMAKQIEEANSRLLSGANIDMAKQIEEANSRLLSGANIDMAKQIEEANSRLLSGANIDMAKQIEEANSRLLSGANIDMAKQIEEANSRLLSGANIDMAKQIEEANSRLLSGANIDMAKQMAEANSRLLSGANIDMAKQMAEANRRLSIDVDMLAFYESINSQIKDTIERYSNFDWESFNKNTKHEMREVEGILVNQEKDYWCLDEVIVASLMYGEINLAELPDHIDKNLEMYVEEIVQDPIYSLHVSLIKESYKAYKAGFYRMCVMPLFAAFEHVFTLWFMGGIKQETVSVNRKPNVKGLYYKIKPEVYTDKEKEQFDTIFSLSVLRTYKSMFVKIPEELCQELNRNSIAHGYHDYNSISKTDVLKLFQLLKSTLILKTLTPKILAE